MKLTPRTPAEGINNPPEHPLKEPAVLLAGGILVVVSLITVTAFAVDIAVRFVSPEREQAVFAPLLPTALEDMEAEEGRDEAAEAALAPLFERVRDAGPDLGYDYQLRVLCTDLPNAFALPGGGLVVTSGLLHELETEQELAFILGHELGHFSERHHLRSMGRGVAVALAAGLVTTAGGGDIDTFLEVARLALQRSHDREQETDADRVGAEVVHELYGHVGSGPRVMKVLSSLDQTPRWAGRLDFARTHPVGDARIDALRATAEEHGWATDGDVGTPLPDALRSACKTEESAEKDDPSSE